MAAGPFILLDIAVEKIGLGAFNFNTDDFKVAICTKEEALTSAFVGTSTNAQYSDLLEEITGDGYTAGGVEMSNVAWARAGAVSTLTADPTIFESLTATDMKFGVVYRDDEGDEEIIGFFDLEEDDPDGRISEGGNFILTYAEGLFSGQWVAPE